MSQRLVGLLLFPRVTQLDLTGPYEVFARLPNTRVHLVADRLDPVETDRGLVILPSVAYATCPQLDVIMVPGGPGQQDLMDDPRTLEFLREQAAKAAYVTSVCTGSLVLGAAGLLKGRRATCHWAAIDLLAHLGAIPTHERVVVDGNVVVRDMLVHDAPKPFDRVQVRAISRNEMQPDPAIGPREPVLHELGVMIARIVEKDMDERQHRIESFDRFQKSDRRGGVDGFDLDHPGLPVPRSMAP